MLNSLMKVIQNRYKFMVEDMNEDYDLLVQSDGQDSKFDTNMVWINDIIEQCNEEPNENNLDLAVACIIKEELIIENQK